MTQLAYYADSSGASFGTQPQVVLSLPEAAIVRSLQVVPNPSTSGRFRLIGLEGKSATYVVFDSQGRRVNAGHLTGAAPEVNLADLPAGLYLLRGEAAGQAFTRRLVRE